MITTVTTTTVTAVASFGVETIPGVVAVAVLLFFLVQYEFATALGPRMQPLARNLTIAITPLFIAFTAIWVNRLIGLL